MQDWKPWTVEYRIDREHKTGLRTFTSMRDDTDMVCIMLTNLRASYIQRITINNAAVHTDKHTENIGLMNIETGVQIRNK